MQNNKTFVDLKELKVWIRSLRYSIEDGLCLELSINGAPIVEYNEKDLIGIIFFFEMNWYDTFELVQVWHTYLSLLIQINEYTAEVGRPDSESIIPNPIRDYIKRHGRGQGRAGRSSIDHQG